MPNGQDAVFSHRTERKRENHIGTNLHGNTDIHFLRVEPIWIALKWNENGWDKVREEIFQCFKKNTKVMIEILGAGEGFNDFLSTLKSQYDTRFIKIETDLELCYKRVRERGGKNHTPVSEDKVREYNEIATQVTLDWDLIIENTGGQYMGEVAEKIVAL